MKKGVSKLVFGLILFIFLCSNVFAVGTFLTSTCEIVPRTSCGDDVKEYIVMGLSDLTDAHGELASQNNYDYVLCCGLPGSATCNEDNKIIGLSSSTNAHAEILNNYPDSSDVCFGDFVCRKLSSGTTCGTDEFGILSLSADTNAHIGKFNDFSTKICCGSQTFTAQTCELVSATWTGTAIQDNKVVAGSKVYLQVIGSGPECNGQTILFEVKKKVLLGDDVLAVSQPVEVSFNGATALGSWIAEGGNHYFTALLDDSDAAPAESNILDVSNLPNDYCDSILTCEDYTSEEECNTNSPCNTDLVAQGGGAEGLVDCNDESFFCGCSWNIDEGNCKFSWSEITGESCGSPDTGGCNYGCTLCSNAETGDYCSVGSCPEGENPVSNEDGICEFGEGCTSVDCLNGDTDSCNQGLFCSLQKCFSFDETLEPAADLGECIITQTITKGCDTEPVGFKTIKATGTWTGLPGSGQVQCESYQQEPITVPCPAQVQLPFFDYFEMIIAVATILLIYVSLVVRRRFLKLRKKHK